MNKKKLKTLSNMYLALGILNILSLTYILNKLLTGSTVFFGFIAFLLSIVILIEAKNTRYRKGAAFGIAADVTSLFTVVFLVITFFHLLTTAPLSFFSFLFNQDVDVGTSFIVMLIFTGLFGIASFILTILSIIYSFISYSKIKKLSKLPEYQEPYYGSDGYGNFNREDGGNYEQNYGSGNGQYYGGDYSNGSDQYQEQFYRDENNRYQGQSYSNKNSQYQGQGYSQEYSQHHDKQDQGQQEDVQDPYYR